MESIAKSFGLYMYDLRYQRYHMFLETYLKFIATLNAKVTRLLESHPLYMLALFWWYMY